MPFLVNRLQPRRLTIVGPPAEMSFDFGVMTYAGDIFHFYHGGGTGSAQYMYYQGTRFSPDGRYMYTTEGATTGIVRRLVQYEMTTPWELSTCRFYGKELVFASFIGLGIDIPRSVVFTPDGLTMYVLTSATPIHKFTLTTAWDINTASYSTFVTIQNAANRDFDFSSDGTKMYVVSDTNNSVQQYTLSTPWDLLTATYDTVEFSVASEDTVPQALCFNNDGTRMFVIGTNKRMSQYNLGTAWDVSSASFSGFWLNLEYIVGGFGHGLTDTITGIRFSADGTSLYVSAYYQYVAQFRLSTPWDITTATWDDGSVYTTTPYQNTLTYWFEPEDIKFNASGTVAYIFTEKGLMQHDAAVPWDISSLTFTGKIGNTVGKTSTAVASSTLTDLAIKPDGTKMYTATSSTIYEYDILTAWDADMVKYRAVTFSTSTQTSTSLRGFVISDDGTKLIAMRGNSATVTSNILYQYNFGTPWDLSTLSYASISRAFAGLEPTHVQGMTVSPDGTRLFTIQSNFTNNHLVHSFTFGTPWDITTLTFDGISFATRPPVESINSLSFSDDGLKMYVSGGDVNGQQLIYQYTLGTAWNVSTAVYDDIAIRAFTPRLSEKIIHIDPTGSYYYAVGLPATITAGTWTPLTGGTVQKVQLPTPWKLSSTITDSVTNVNLGNYTFSSGAVSPDGDIMYLYDDILDQVVEFTLATANDPTTGVYSSALAVGASVTDIVFNYTGNTMYVAKSTTVDIYTLSTPWSLASATLTTAGQALSNSHNFGIFDSGTKLIRAANVTSSTRNTMYWSKLNTPDDIQTQQLVDSFHYLGGPAPLYVSPHNPTQYYVGNSTFINQLQFIAGIETEPFQPVQAVAQGVFHVPGTGATRGIRFKSDGTELYGLDTVGNIYQHSLSIPWTPEVNLVGSIATTEITSTRGFCFSPDGTKMFVCGIPNGGINIAQYNLGTAWDITTAVYSVGFNTSAQVVTINEVFISPDGTKMVVLGDSTFDILYQYTLNTPWDVTTAVYDSVSHNPIYLFGNGTTSGSGQSYGFTYSSDGMILLVTGLRSFWPHKVCAFAVTTPYTLAGIKYMGRCSRPSQNATYYAVEFSADGTRMFWLDPVTGVETQIIAAAP